MPGKFQSALGLPVSTGYFSALHIPIIEGRGFTQSDSIGSLPVAIVSERFVVAVFPGAEPAGPSHPAGRRTTAMIRG